MTRLFFVLGVVFLLLSGLSFFLEKVAGKGIFSVLGHLPGDIYVDRPGFKFYFPLMTSLLVSVFLSLLFYLVSRFFGRS
ncbi:DUF2905 domain-containing protein [Leptospirillum ferriphilum]|jgi:hypothetical protein|nr:DUF2905 domain-containing protein [Leptospirillum ferriphilum]